MQSVDYKQRQFSNQITVKYQINSIIYASAIDHKQQCGVFVDYYGKETYKSKIIN